MPHQACPSEGLGKPDARPRSSSLPMPLWAAHSIRKNPERDPEGQNAECSGSSGVAILPFFWVPPARMRTHVTYGWCGTSSEPSRWERDHPRACGEQRCSQNALTHAPGSSPRVRGAVLAVVREGPYVGIIPARAGSSILWRWFTSSSRDHPRACGEQASWDWVTEART